MKQAAARTTPTLDGNVCGSRAGEFTRNRGEFSSDDLVDYNGKRVAFSADGREIVASCEKLEALDELIRTAGCDPEEVFLERIEIEDSAVGGAQLH